MVAKVLMITVASVAVAAATYFALDTKFPQTQAESASANTGDVDAIFAGTLNPDAAGSGETAVADVDSDAATEADAPVEITEVAAADDMSATLDQAAVETEAAPEPAAEPEAEPTSEPTPEPTAAPTPEPTPEPTTAPTAAPKPVEEPKPSQAAVATARPTSKPAAPKPALTQWWGTPSDQRLSITYAGSAAYTRAIVLMFNGDFDDASKAAASLGVTDAGGNPVSGSWQVGSTNKRMLLFPVSRNGTYNVSVNAALADRNGRSLGASAQGPVQVQ